MSYEGYLAAAIVEANKPSSDPVRGAASPPDDALLTAARKLASYNAWNGSLHDGRKLTYVLHDDITALRAALPTETTGGGPQ